MSRRENLVWACAIVVLTSILAFAVWMQWTAVIENRRAQALVPLPAPADAIDGALGVLEAENDGSCDPQWLQSGAVAFNLFISPNLAVLAGVCRAEGCDEASLLALMARVDALTTAAYMCTAKPPQ